MQGFFNKKETQSNSRPDGKIYSCASCGLIKNCQNPKMKASGNFKKGILNIGNQTTIIDDKKNKQWQTKEGKFLQSIYSELGIDLFDDCLNINAVNCVSLDNKKQNRLPNNYEIDCCRKSILKLIKKTQPKIIILFGNEALYSVIGKKWKKDFGTIKKWRGFSIPDQEHKAFLFPVFNPKYVMHSEKEVLTVWKQDLNNAFSYLDAKFKKYKKPNINYINDLTPLKQIKNSLVAFDYETTGLKPHAKGHRIVCASIAVDENNVFVFSIPKKRKELQPFIDILKNNQIGKMAHNMKFEDTWTNVRLKTEINYWAWDSMLAAHILDNRPEITGLKFQTYINFGIIDYSSEIEPYLKGIESKNGNSLNKILELYDNKVNEKKLLEYCALDSIFQYRLAMLQIKKIDYSFLPF